MAALGEDLLRVVNQLQDLVFNTIGTDSLDLPQIVCPVPPSCPFFSFFYSYISFFPVVVLVVGLRGLRANRKIRSIVMVVGRCWIPVCRQVVRARKYRRPGLSPSG